MHAETAWAAKKDARKGRSGLRPRRTDQAEEEEEDEEEEGDEEQEDDDEDKDEDEKDEDEEGKKCKPGDKACEDKINDKGKHPAAKGGAR